MFRFIGMVTGIYCMYFLWGKIIKSREKIRENEQKSHWLKSHGYTGGSLFEPYSKMAIMLKITERNNTSWSSVTPRKIIDIECLTKFITYSYHQKGHLCVPWPQNYSQHSIYNPKSQSHSWKWLYHCTNNAKLLYSMGKTKKKHNKAFYDYQNHLLLICFLYELLQATLRITLR